MAHSLSKSDEIRLMIPEAVTKDGVTRYVIQVIIGNVEWTVQRRYREFAELHDDLQARGVDKEALPEKKLIGNKDPGFIKKRRKDLETYLQSVFHFLKHSQPRSLVHFLDFPSYDLHHVLRSISSTYFESVESGCPAKSADWSPLEMHAVSERLKAPRPPEDTDDDTKHGFVNVADLTCQLEALKIAGKVDKLGSSNIVPNNLSYDFLAFKNLARLHLVDVRIAPDKIGSFGMLRKSLRHLTANKCSLKSISSLLNGDSPVTTTSAKDNENKGGQQQMHTAAIWKSLQFLDLRQNELERVDEAVHCAPNLRTLLLGYNAIEKVENLDKLTELCTLELTANKLEEAVQDMHTKVGQVLRLDISGNKIRSLSGVSKLYSLTELNASANKINDLDNVFPVSNLPNLESLNLQGNHVTTCVDYRIKVFESFGKRCSDLCLDNETPSQQEIDKVSVLMALRVAREGRSPASLFGNLPRRV